MNIEEERKAFEKVAREKGVNVVRSNIAMAFVNGKTISIGDYFEPAYTAFEFWIQAKQHAVEMAKPVVKIALIEGVNGVKYSIKCEGALLVIKLDYLEAVQWAKDNGYRVEGITK